MICLHLLAKKGEHLRRFWKCRSKIAGRLNFDVGFHGYVVDVVGTPRFTPCKNWREREAPNFRHSCPSRCRPIKKVSEPRKKKTVRNVPCTFWVAFFFNLVPDFSCLYLEDHDLRLMLLAYLRLAEYANMHTYNIAHIYSYISYSLICNKTSSFRCIAIVFSHEKSTS